MKTLRVVLIASVVALAAACSSTPSKTVATKAAPAAVTLAGNWALTIESQMGPQETKLILNQAGQELTGSLDAPAPIGNAPVKGSVVGNDVNMSFVVNAQGMEIKIDLIGTQESGAAMKGRAVFGSYGEGTFSAKKNP